MSHHGTNENFLQSEIAKELLLGSTGKFPEGKLSADDEGEIKIAIVIKDSKIIMDFGKPVAWFGFTKRQAKDLGQFLINKSNEL